MKEDVRSKKVMKPLQIVTPCSSSLTVTPQFSANAGVRSLAKKRIGCLLELKESRLGLFKELLELSELVKHIN